MKITKTKIKQIVSEALNLNEQGGPTRQWTRFVVDATGWEDEGGVFDNDDRSLSDYHGKTIYNLEEEAHGYYNITLRDGVKFYAISTAHIKCV